MEQKRRSKPPTSEGALKTSGDAGGAVFPSIKTQNPGLLALAGSRLTREVDVLLPTGG